MAAEPEPPRGEMDMDMDMDMDRDTAAGRTCHQLDRQELAAIECPLQLGERAAGAGPAERYGRLVERLGGARRLSSLLQAKNPNRPVELKLVPSDANPFVRPIAGEFVNTANFLVRITKRTRRPKNPPSGNNADDLNSRQEGRLLLPPAGPHPPSPDRLYRVEPVGVIPLTVRFRALADYHYTPDLQHPINVLACDIRSLNAEGVLNFRFEAESEDYSTSSKIALFPPPLFSRYLVPQLYNYRQNAASVLTCTPEGDQRLVNRTKYVPLAPQSITFDQPQVPQGPVESDVVKRKPSDEPIYQQIETLFKERPMWIRLAFQNQFSPRQVRLFRQNREILVLSCYTFVDGPFKDFLVRFKYDPRLDPERISMRNVDRTDASDKFIFKLMKRTAQKGSGSAKADTTVSNQRRDHIFDGLELHSSVGTYQLCDITDPLLRSLIDSTKGVLPKCHVRTGWYTSNAIEQIRCILRNKLHALLEEQRVIKDIEFVDLLDIDVSLEAADLVKKSGATEKRFRGRRMFYPTREGPDPDPGPGLDLDGEQYPADGAARNPLPAKLHPNPLHRYRREKNRIKAKPADKSVTFFDPKDLDEDMQMAQNDSNRTALDKTDDGRSGATPATTGWAGKASASQVPPPDAGGSHEEDDEDEDEEDDEEEDVDDENSSDDVDEEEDEEDDDGDEDEEEEVEEELSEEEEEEEEDNEEEAAGTGSDVHHRDNTTHSSELSHVSGRE